MRHIFMKTIGALALLLTTGVPVAQAYDFQVRGIYYNYTGDRKGAIVTWESISSPSYSGDIVIPSEVTYQMQTLKVKQIDDRAFFNCQGVTSVTLPEGIISIGEQAFSHCYAMTRINIPSTVTRIGDFAFEFCEDMTSFTIPASVSMIGYSVFQQCLGLREFIVDEGNPYYTSEDGILYLADKSILVQYPASKPGNELVIPDAVSQLPDYAFSPNLNLEKIAIGPNLKKIPAGTFCECEELLAFSVDEANTIVCDKEGVLFSKDGSTLMQYPLGRYVDEYKVPEGTQAIADMAMVGCAISRLELPESLKSLGMFSLTAAPILESITSYAKVPPVANSMTFDDNIMAGTVLYVNKEDLDAYKNADVWSSFAQIRYIGETGVDDIHATQGLRCHDLTVEAPGYLEVFDLMGRLVAAGDMSVTLPQRGLYIVKTSEQVIKISL